MSNEHADLKEVMQGVADGHLEQAIKDTGGPAYPQYKVDHYGVAHVNGGMTLRDVFAKAAMQGLCSRPDVEWQMPETARAAYLMADAMLAERAK